MCQAVLRSTSSERGCSEIFSPAFDHQVGVARGIGGVEVGGPLARRNRPSGRRSRRLWSWALKHSRNESSTTRSPRALGAGIASPLRNTATHLPKPEPQSSGVISVPAGVSHAMSRTWSPAADRLAVEEPPAAEHRVVLAQLGHLAGERQQVGVGLAQRPVHPRRSRSPGSTRCCCRCWVRPISSPWTDHRGALADHQRADDVAHLLGAQLAGSRDRRSGPSTPQFHDRLWLSPSRLSSPLASLCFSL